MKNKSIHAFRFIIYLSCIILISGCSVYYGDCPECTSRVYIVDNIKIEDPCVIKKDSVLYVISRKSEIYSSNDIPNLNAEMADMYDIRCYTVWLPETCYQTPNDFFFDRGLRRPKRIWSALYEIVDTFDCINFKTSFTSNLQLIWEHDGIALYDFIKQPKSFLLVVQQDCEVRTEGFEGDLAVDVAPIYVSRAYRSYICPVQKKYRLRL